MVEELSLIYKKNTTLRDVYDKGNLKVYDGTNDFIYRNIDRGDVRRNIFIIESGNLTVTDYNKISNYIEDNKNKIGKIGLIYNNPKGAKGYVLKFIEKYKVYCIQKNNGVTPKELEIFFDNLSK